MPHYVIVFHPHPPPLSPFLCHFTIWQMPPVTTAPCYPPFFIPLGTDSSCRLTSLLRERLILIGCCGKHLCFGGHFITPRKNYCCVRPLEPMNIFKRRQTEIEKLNLFVEERRGGINGEGQSVHSRKTEIQRRNQEGWCEDYIYSLHNKK